MNRMHLIILLIALVVLLSLPVVEACVCRESNLTVDVGMFAGDTKQIFFFPSCNYITANVSASYLINRSEYWLNGCVEYSPNNWNCTCSKNFSLAITTKPNTINKYLILAKEYYSCDYDGDGFPAEKDCNDNNPKIYPGAQEICNGKDDDCDGKIDESACKSVTYYCDKDLDGFISVLSSGSCSSFNCIPNKCSSTKGTDCNDKDKYINPKGYESCDSKDNDCDGKVDESPCTASKFCSTISIKNSRDYANIWKCHMADWMENEIMPYPRDCTVQYKSNRTSNKVSCIANTYAN